MTTERGSWGVIADLVKTIIQTMFRFFPFPTETGLRIIGQPSRDAPVFLTCNFELTVLRVKRALKGLDCYLLVAPSKGVNVWCASGGGMLNAHSVTAVLKTSGIGEKVDHRTLVLPQFAAPGIDVGRVAEETGWDCRFGPAYAQDIADYVAAGYQKTEAMRQARFPLGHRLEMAVMWATPLSIVAAIPVAIFARGSLPGVLALVWGFSLLVFGFYGQVMRFVPGPVGLVKTLVLGLLGVAGVAAYGLLVGGWTMASIVAWSLAILAIALILGFDLDGSSPLYAGSTVAFWGRKWPWVLRIWAKFGYDLEEHFALAVDRVACAGCLTCIDVCPKSVFDLYHINGRRKAWIARPEACEQCTACVKQCPEDAILANPPIRTFVGAGVEVE
jgi:NAD-dependent dihydropyrimidine dehydrogenase PreA subunit